MNPLSSSSHSSESDRVILVAVERGPDEDGSAGKGAPIGELNGVEAVVHDREARDKAVDDTDSSCVQRRPLIGGERIGVGEEDDVRRPLTDQEGVLHCSRIRAEDSERLIANLPAVAVRAMQKIAPPPLADARDVRQRVAEAGGDQYPSRVQDSAAREANCEARLDLGDVILE